MKVAVTGASGLVGTSLMRSLASGAHDVLRLVRRPSGNAREVSWAPQTGVAEPERLEGLDAVVHLAGENIAAKRWSTAQKAAIQDSRVEGTRKLCAALAALTKPPTVLVSASAVGIYGDRGRELLAEDSSPGEGFLAQVCRDWEAAAATVTRAGTRVVNLRFGVILSTDGGALAKMLTPFRMGVAGVLGRGEQYMSWIALDDAVGAIDHVLRNPSLRGPVNAVSPNPVTNLEFTKAMGRVLHRPTVLPMPAFAVRLAFGEVADAALLASTRATPRVLQASGFIFRFPEIEAALKHVLGRAPK